MHTNNKIPCVYILTNKQNGTLYVGVTSNLPQRIKQHKEHLLPGFTDTYNITTLVYYEVCDTMESAILREKQLKSGSRKKKLLLIENKNPEWKDLYEEILS